MRAKHHNRITQYLDPRHDWRFADPATQPAAYDEDFYREDQGTSVFWLVLVALFVVPIGLVVLCRSWLS